YGAGSTVKSRSPALTSEPSRKSTDWIAPATRERIWMRLTASRRPENSCQLFTSRVFMMVTVTGTAGASTAPSDADAFVLRGRSRKTAAVKTDAAKPRPVPARAQSLNVDIIVFSLRILDAGHDQWVFRSNHLVLSSRMKLKNRSEERRVGKVCRSR